MSKSRNPRLKKAHTQSEYTQEQIIELQKCISDPIYFITKYVYIKHPIRGQILFSLYPYQETMIRNFMDNRFCINLLPRQVGKTETISAYLLWFAIFNSDKTIIITSNKADSSMEIIAKIQNAYEELPHWIKPGIDDSSWNKHMAAFDNKSKIEAVATSADAARGRAVSILYSDEFAFVPAHLQEAFFKSVFPVLSTGGQFIISSTPNGDINKFAELWRGAELGGNVFHPFTVPWYAPPGRDEKFKEDIIKTFGLQAWLQEYECHFISNEMNLINAMIIAELEKSLASYKPAFQIQEQSFFKRINQDATYLVGIDPATGNGKDYSVIQVIEFPSMEQVMEYRTNSVSNVVVYAYLKKVLKFLEHFAKEVYFTVERNGVGVGILSLYEADRNPPEKAVLISEENKEGQGFFTTDKNKIESCLLLKNLFENKQVKLYSTILLKELKSYVRAKGSYSAKEGATDDCIAAILLALKLLKAISNYDPRAYHKLYHHTNDGSEDWIKAVYGDVVPDNYDNFGTDENAEPAPWTMT